jgi:lysozyme family protein
MFHESRGGFEMQSTDDDTHDLNDLPDVEDLVVDPLDRHGDDDATFGFAIEAAPVRKWRVAEALLTLRATVNTAAPRRSKVSDGTIGDPAHAVRTSDHNPWIVDGGVGVVTGMDITHDPRGGCDAHRLAEVLRTSGDRRLKYIISNRRIASAAPKGSAPAWAWRTYTGANPHNHHAHISVVAEKSGYDSAADWQVAPAFVQIEAAPVAADPDEQVVEVERALEATLAAEADSGVPLLIRLTELGERVETLIAAYNEAVRSPSTEPDGVVAEAAAPSFDSLKDEYRRLFETCTIPSDKAGVVAFHRSMLLKGRARYEQVAAKVDVPWWFVGIVHAMEGSFNFATHLHNGDPLSARTVQVPKGRPKTGSPPFTWIDSAVDALTFEGFGGATDWSVARALYRWEAYNGWGYRRASVAIPTPYLWSFSNHYTKGKFVRDGVFDRGAVSKQCGAAVMLKALQNAGDVKLDA